MQRRARSTVLVAVAALLLSVPLCSAQLAFKCTTPKSSKDPKKPNTFIGTTGSQIASSLLAANTPAMLWGTVPSSSIRATCDQIVKTGTHTINAAVTGDSWSSHSSYNIKLQLVATGGCNAAADNSGTQFVFTDPSGRKIALVCPKNAGKIGCGIYWTGKDVSSLHSKAKKAAETGRRLQSTRRMLDCSGGAGAGATVTGAAVGSVATAIGESAACAFFGPFAPFCVIGVVGVAAAVGAGIGCAVDTGCFPGEALVMTELGGYRNMSQLAVGDKVGVMGPHNLVSYQEIYAFGHQDAAARSSMVHLQLQSLKETSSPRPSLTLSPLHFVPIVDGGHARAEDVQLGDLVWALDHASQTLLPHNVTGKTPVLEQGLFNPLTLGGSILVNDVVASVHSEWFLDSWFDYLGLTSMLPSAYQAVLAPARALFHVLGKEQYVRLYHYLDTRLDIAAYGTAHGGKIAATVGLSALLMAAMATNTVGKAAAKKH